MRKSTSKVRESLSLGSKPGISLQLRGGLREAMETYGEAISMAESGELGLAREIMGDFHAEHRKILVLAEGDGVPEPMVAYAVNLAERLGFDLVLLSVGPASRSGLRFEERTRAAGQPLLDEAARRGVACAHLLRQGPRDEVLNAVSVELRRVEFVITRRPEAERRHAALTVPEFSLKC
ncbi:MAG: universal stress protein [Proteobacteria bacterium]|nr:universal stress protein [Pseudomonadota bacterium]MBU1596074.1 universal stress protein [Pseudomonadota bacterium]